MIYPTKTNMGCQCRLLRQEAVLILFYLSLVLIVKAQGITPIVITEATKASPVILSCSNSSTGSSFNWTRDSQMVSKNGNNSFEIDDPKKVGLYNCSSTEYSNAFLAMNYSESYIEHTTKSVYATEGQVNFTLRCHSYSYPDPIFHWLKEVDGETVNLSSTVTPEYRIKTEGTLSDLIIVEVTADSRADYACVSQNAAGKGEKKILVRVQDKLAALWPFLGIVVEIVVLAVIMLIISRNSRASSSPAVSSGGRRDGNKTD